jgi:hypothetical protein
LKNLRPISIKRQMVAKKGENSTKEDNKDYIPDCIKNQISKKS